MAERVTKSIRVTAEEWAEVVAAAGPMPVATWVREAVLVAARGRGVVAVPAAPEERGSSGRASVDPGLRVDPAASSRPVGSAGSVGSAVPPAAGRPAGASPSPSGGAPGAGTLQLVVIRLLTERFGRRADHPAAAARMIREGRVSVYGEVVRSLDAPIAEGDDVRIV